MTISGLWGLPFQSLYCNAVGQFAHTRHPRDGTRPLNLWGPRWGATKSVIEFVWDPVPFCGTRAHKSAGYRTAPITITALKGAQNTPKERPSRVGECQGKEGRVMKVTGWLGLGSRARDAWGLG